MTTYGNKEPAFNSVPPVVVAMAFAIIAIEALFWLGTRGLFFGPEAAGWRVEAIREWALWPRLFAAQVASGDLASDELVRFISYPFVHRSFVGAVMAAVLLLAIGNFVGRVFGTFAVLGVFFVSSIIGGFVYCGLVPGAGPLIGAFTGVYGLLGAYTFLLWVNMGRAREDQRQAFSLIGWLLGAQLFVSLLFGTQPYWIANLAGGLAGFVIVPSFAPGSLQRLLQKLRQR